MSGKTYADGLREAARICRAEILPPKPSNVVELKKPSPEMDVVMGLVKPVLEASMTMLADRFDRLARECTDTSSAGSEVPK
jgi:hypothetical protein